ncbi:hypothetical protein LguiA_011153 [Lonicera macranthoides]
MAAAADGSGCLSGHDFVSRNRPYHRNCTCELHKSRGDHCSHACNGVPKVAYPIRRAWSEGSLVLIASANPSPSTSPAGEPGRMNLASCHQDFMIIR